MLLLINILIIFFIFLISYQLFLGNHEYKLEGFDNANDYKEYDTNNPNNTLILAQQNAGNISFLKKRIDEYGELSKQVVDLSNNLQTLQGQVDQLMQSQQDYADQLTGGTPPTITGAVSEDTTNNNVTSS